MLLQFESLVMIHEYLNFRKGRRIQRPTTPMTFVPLSNKLKPSTSRPIYSKQSAQLQTFSYEFWQTTNTPNQTLLKRKQRLIHIIIINHSHIPYTFKFPIQLLKKLKINICNKLCKQLSTLFYM